MSLNSGLVTGKKIEYQDYSGNFPKEDQPFLTNYYSARTSFLTISLTQAGKYGPTVVMPKPIKPWHRASKGATETFEGGLTELFPELKDLSEAELRELDKKRHEF